MVLREKGVYVRMSLQVLCGLKLSRGTDELTESYKLLGPLCKKGEIETELRCS